MKGPVSIPDGKGRLVGRKFPGQPDEGIHRNPCLFRDKIRPIFRKNQLFKADMLLSSRICPVFEPERMIRDEILVVEALFNDHVGNGKGDQPFCPGTRRNPLIGFDARDGESRFNLNQPSPLLRPSSPEIAIGAQGLDRRPVRFEEVRTKGEQVSGIFKVINWLSVDPLREVKALDGCFFPLVLIVDVIRRSKGLQEAFPEGPHQSSISSTQNGKAMRLPVLPKFFQ
jgi:hypothetical protein